MAVDRIHLIPCPDRLEDSVRLCREWDAAFEYNDFFDPCLLDDERGLKDRIERYRSLKRPVNTDTLHGVFFDICLNSSDPQIRRISEQRVISSMDIASELNCRGVIFHTNLIPGFEPDFYLDGWLKANLDFYRELAARYEGIEIWIENMFDYKPDMVERFGKETAADDRIGLCYDVAHGHVHDVPMEEWIGRLAPFIRHLHINDNDGSSDQHLAVGDGTIDWDRYFSLLRENNVNAGMLIEVSGIDRQQRSLEFLKRNGYI